MKLLNETRSVTPEIVLQKLETALDESGLLRCLVRA